MHRITQNHIKNPQITFRAWQSHMTKYFTVLKAMRMRFLFALHIFAYIYLFHFPIDSPDPSFEGVAGPFEEVSLHFDFFMVVHCYLVLWDWLVQGRFLQHTNKVTVEFGVI